MGTEKSVLIEMGRRGACARVSSCNIPFIRYLGNLRPFVSAAGLPVGLFSHP